MYLHVWCQQATGEWRGTRQTLLGINQTQVIRGKSAGKNAGSLVGNSP
jgi:hypothetical protein